MSAACSTDQCTTWGVELTTHCMVQASANQEQAGSAEGPNMQRFVQQLTGKVCHDRHCVMQTTHIT